MKKWIILLLVVIVFVFLLTRIDMSSTNNTENENIEKETLEMEMTKESLEDILKKENIKVEKKNVKKVSENKNSGPSAEVYFTRGKEKVKAKNYKGAISDLTKAIKKNPKYIEAYRYRALAKDSIGDYNGAEEDYEHAFLLESSRNDSINKERYDKMIVMVDKGNQYFKKQKYQDAIYEYNSAIIAYPNFSQAYIRKADANYMLKNYQEALKDYDKALRINMEDNFLYLKRANTKYRLKKYKSAIEDYEIFLKQESNQANIYYKLAGSYIYTEKFDKAYDNLNKYLSLTNSRVIKIQDFNKWNAVLDKYTTNETIRDIKSLLKSLELVN